MMLHKVCCVKFSHQACGGISPTGLVVADCPTKLVVANLQQALWDWTTIVNLALLSVRKICKFVLSSDLYFLCHQLNSYYELQQIMLWRENKQPVASNVSI